MCMARVARVDVGGEVYHVLNRAVGRLQIFNRDDDYRLFLYTLREAKEMFDMRILSFTAMPNHWHLQLFPHNDRELGKFMHQLTNSHTRCVHSITQTIGTGPLYQGRYKSFIAESDEHVLTVLKYIERNPVRAGLVQKAEDWKWGSAWIRVHGTDAQCTLLAESPVPLPQQYRRWVNTPDSEVELERLRNSVNRGTPYGNPTWIEQMVDTHKLTSTVRKRGRPVGS